MSFGISYNYRDLPGGAKGALGTESCDDEDEDSSGCIPAGRGDGVGCCSTDSGGGGGLTEAMGGRSIPLAQLLEQTLKPVLQSSTHALQYWV